MDKKAIIGIDLGGTKILTGAIDNKGKILGSPLKLSTIGTDPAKAIVKRLTGSVEETMKSLRLKEADVAGIGIGSTGPLDIREGIILECPQLPNMNYFPLRKTIEDHFGIPVFVNNDANCLIFAEAIYGSASGKRNVVGFTLGTGIGCAIILDKKIFNGATGTAAEIWPSPYRSGIIEDFVSGRGVSAIYKVLTKREASSLDVYKLALGGDSHALQTWNEFGMHLAVPVAWAINLLDPEVVVLGGSIAGAYTFFKDSMEEYLRKWICPVPAERTRVVPAKLGDNAGFIGAACLVIENSYRQVCDKRS